MMDLPIQLIVKVQQFEDKRIEAKASWNIKELKGKLSEIYPTSTEEQKLIYSGKLLNDTVVLKDILREYEGQEAHTVHLVFTPKSGRGQSKFDSHTSRQSPAAAISTNQSTIQPESMSTSELRQRNTAPVPSTTAVPSLEQQQQQPPNTTNIPSNYLNAFYGGGSGDANSILAHQYAMQTWMQQAYTQYMNQYMTLLQSPEAFYQMSQQQQMQSPQNYAFIQPQMPFAPPSAAVSATANEASQAPQSPNNDVQAAAPAQAAPQPAAEQRRFPNIIQDEQENRDWLDILYSMSRLMILLCLVYFYSSPIRCLVVILIGISIYLYHIYKQNQVRLNNNNTSRVNLNVNRPVPAPVPAQPAVEAQENAENVNRSETDGAQQSNENESEPLVAQAEPTVQEEPQVPLITIVRTFVLSFFSSIIPEAPAL